MPGVAEQGGDDVRVHRDHAVDVVARRLRRTGRLAISPTHGKSASGRGCGTPRRRPRRCRRCRSRSARSSGQELLVVVDRGRRPRSAAASRSCARPNWPSASWPSVDRQLGVAADEAAEGPALRRRREQQEVRARPVGAEHRRAPVDRPQRVARSAGRCSSTLSSKSSSSQRRPVHEPRRVGVVRTSAGGRRGRRAPASAGPRGGQGVEVEAAGLAAAARSRSISSSASRHRGGAGRRRRGSCPTPPCWCWAAIGTTAAALAHGLSRWAFGGLEVVRSPAGTSRPPCRSRRPRARRRRARPCSGRWRGRGATSRAA